MEPTIKLSKKEVNNIIIFYLQWELDETNADKTYQQIIGDIWDFKEKKIVFNLNGLIYINSKSIWYLSAIYSDLEDNDGCMSICNCEDSIKEILELSWLNNFVPITETEKEAINVVS